MKAMIMAAGVGSRLMPMTASLPKPMVPMVNRPLMENIIRLLRQHGCEEIICNLHYHADLIRYYFGDGSRFGVSLNYSYEPELLGTAGGVKKCQWFLDETFVVVSGDALTDLDLSELLSIHRQKGALATIALKEVEEVQHFGVVIRDKEGRIKSFQEKPRPEEALSRMANMGIYVFEPEIFNYIPAGQFFDFGKELFPYLVKNAAPFYGVETTGYWCDVGNLESYRQAHVDVLEGRVKIEVIGQVLSIPNGGRVLMGEGVKLGRNLDFSGYVVLGPGCHLGDKVKLANTIIWNNTTIGQGAIIEEAIIGSRCWISQGASIKSQALASDIII